MQDTLGNEILWRSAEDIADRILSSQSTENFDSFSANFTPDLRAKLLRENFLETINRFKKDYGNYKHRKPLCILNGATCIPVIWLVNFDKTSQDFLFQLRLVEDKGRLLVDSVLFRTWII